MIEKMSLVYVMAPKKEDRKLYKTLIENTKLQLVDADSAITSLEIQGKGVHEDLLKRRSKKESKEREISVYIDKLQKLAKSLAIEEKMVYQKQEKELSLEEIYKEIDEFISKFDDFVAEENKKLKYLRSLKELIWIENMKEVDVDLVALSKMENFKVSIGTFDIHQEKRMHMNYENLQLIIIPIARARENKIFMVISPADVSNDTDELLRSLSFRTIDVFWELMANFKTVNTNIKAEIKKTEENLEELRKSIFDFVENSKSKIIEFYSLLSLEKQKNNLRISAVYSDFFVCSTFWTPSKNLNSLEKILSKEIDGSIVVDINASDLEDKSLKVPTKLSNSRFIKPFEELINLYGVPSYSESDPTFFVAIIYMLLFGSMFGDLGQGLVIFLAGLIYSKKNKKNNFGAMIKRIGVSSMVFGVFYDSFFGIEHLISGVFANIFSKFNTESLFFRPIENTEITLISAVVFGVLILFISYLYSIYNKLKLKDIENGIFGRDGINGLVLFISMIALALSILFNLGSFYIKLIAFVLILSAVLLFFKEPLSHIFQRKKPLHSVSPKDYYVESIFELLESFMSMFSNTVSFIRVGAFALNHVGLFIAFHTLAKLINSLAGDIAMFLIGNLLIIALEGLIVFIQGLRLVYYEMFSKYFVGGGIEFKPIDINNN